MNDNTMQQLHDERNNAILARIHDAMSGLCRATGDCSQAFEEFTRSAIALSYAAQGGVKPGVDSRGSEGQELKA